MEQQTPSYKVVWEFINKYIVPYQFEIFTMITKTIINEYYIDISCQYLDGTKIEANANKYKFVWKPTTFHKRLDSKIKPHLSLLNTENLIDEKRLIKASELNNILNNFAIQNNIDINNIPSGKGIRLTKEQKFARVHQRSKEAKLYKFTGYDKCNYVYKCKAKMKQENKDKEFRTVELIVDYELLKEQARQNLLSKEGIQIRINRSIQVEKTFGQIKNNMRYIRIRRGIKKVSWEIMLMCLGRNIRKLFTFLDGKPTKSSFWNVPLNLKEEKINYPKEKKTVRN